MLPHVVNHVKKNYFKLDALYRNVIKILSKTDIVRIAMKWYKFVNLQIYIANVIVQIFGK